MYKYIIQVVDYWQYKVIAGLVAVIFTEDFFKLLLLLTLLEFLDIFTRWLALSMRCYKDIYPQSPCGLWKALKWMWQARKWRYIRSTGLRDGFCDKMILYLILLLVGALVDSAYSISHAPKVLSAVIVVVLSSTEALSILENLSECNIPIVSRIKEIYKKKNENNIL